MRNLIASLAVVMLHALAPPAPAQTDFALPIFDTGGGNATAFAYGDLNLDGRPDAAVVHSSTDKLSVVLGKPGGFFGSPTLYSTGDDPQAVAIADFDLDGRPDLVSFNQGAGTLTIVLRKLTGPVTWTVPAGGNGSTLAVGDLDHDGDPDVVTGNYTQKTLSVVLGLGPAGLSAPVTHAVNLRPLSLELEDFDGDGSLDVAAVTFQPATVTLWLGDGLGGLGPGTTLASGTSVSGLVVADLDDDRDLDLATGIGTNLVLLRNGPAGFAAPELLPVGLNVEPVAAADFDVDGLIDLLVNTSSPGIDSNLQRMSGTGGGGFAPPVELLPTSLFDIAVDDADDDLRPDIVGTLGGLCVFRGLGGLVSLPPSVALAEQAAVFALGDVDGDGLDDLVSSSINQDFFPFESPGTVSVQLGDGAGGWGAPQPQAFGAVRFLELADVTGDGALDLLTTTGFTNSAIVIAPGDGAGGFGPPSQVSLPSQDASQLAAADLDLDGDVDLAVLSVKEWFMGTQFRNLVSFRNNGAGQWTTFEQNYSSAGQFSAEDDFALGDCDGDGRPDAVIVDQANDRLYYCGNVGACQFGAGVLVGPAFPSSGEQPIGLHDLDTDGALDVVLAGSSMQVWHGQGNGLFDPAQILGPCSGDDVQFADIDGDGSMEIVMDGSDGIWSHVAMVWHADGQGGFSQQRYFAGATARSFVTDADQDGHPDLLTVQAADILIAPEGGDGHVLLNHTLLAAWTDFGHGLAGSFGVPSLVGQGTLKAGSPGTLKLTGANPNKLAVLFIGPTANPTPFKGGMLVPIPPTIMFTLFTSPLGSITVGWSSWKLMPPGTDWFFQYGIVDTAGPAGASLSNAVRALQP